MPPKPSSKANPKQIKLSPSKLGLFEDCPRCFWLDMKKGIKRPGGPFPSLPSGMDRVLKKHFDSFMEKGELPPELCEKDHVKGLKLFEDKKLLEVWRNVQRGLQYLDKKSGVLLRGAVDNILVKGKKLIVLDYKTRGYPCKPDTHEHYRTQMDVYNFLLRKNGYQTEDFTFLLFYHPTSVLRGGEVVFDTELIKVRTDVKRAWRVFRRAVGVLNRRMPKARRGCEFCGLWRRKFNKLHIK